MLRSIIGSSLVYRLLVVVLAGVLIVGGALGLRRMPVDVLPEFSAPYVEVQTEALGLSADEVEQLITVPMEQDLLNGVPWLQTIQSESVTGLSSIVLVFEPGTDLYRARQMVSERMTQAFALPHVSKPPTILQPVSSASRFMIVGLSSKTLSLIDMSVLARWTIVPRLMGVPGVSNVAIWGNRDRQLQVQVDPARLQDKNISLLEVLETTGNALWVSSLSFVEASTPGTGGFIDTAQQRLGIRHISPIVTSETLAEVPIADTGVRLGDVADVVEDHQPLIGDALTNENSSLLLVIQKFPGANTLDVTRGVEDALDELRPGMAGLTMDSSIFRPADFIEAALNNVGLGLLIGFLLIALALAAFFFEWRRVLISLIVIPLALIAAGTVLYLRGATFTAITLVGMLAALGVIIEEAVVDVDALMRRSEQRRMEGGMMTMEETIREASLALRGPLVYTLLISLLAAVPFYFMGGPSNAFFKPLAVSYGLALLVSMLVALTVTPALSMMLIRREAGAVSSRGAGLQTAYASALGWINKRGRLALALVALMTIIGIAVLPSIKQSLLPSFKEKSLLVHLDGAPGASQPESSRIAARMSAELESVDGVEMVAAQVGRAVFGDQVVNVNSTDLWVKIAPDANYDATAAAVRRVVNGYPGINHSVQTYLSEKSSGTVPSATDGMTVRLYGDRDDLLRSSAADISTAISGIQGVSETHVKLPAQQASFEIEVNLAAAQKYGLKPGDVRRSAAIMFSGLQVGSLFEEQKVFDVVVWSTPDTRQSLSSIRDLAIDTPSGARVRLGDVADVRIVPATPIIKHEGVKRYVDIAVKVEGRSLGAVAADITTRIQGMQLPLEFHAAVLGGYAEPRAILIRFLTFASVALLGIFLLLQAALRNWKLALGLLLAIPAALSGGAAAAFLAGGTLSLGSLAGFLALFGIAIRHGILLFSHYMQEEQEGGRSLNEGLVMEGALERLMPLLASNVATGLALSVALFFGGRPGFEFLAPMSIVMLGGLVTVTLVDLFILPGMYLRFGASREADLGLAPVGMADMPPTAAD